MKSTKLVGDRREDAGMDDAAEPDQTLVDILQDLFDGASPETFEDGMDNHFGIELRRIVQQYGVAATDALEKVMHGANIEVIKESLKQMGYMNNKKTQSNRLALLQRALESPDTKIRDAASTGIGAIRNSDTKSPQKTTDSKPRMTISEYIRTHDPEKLQSATDSKPTPLLAYPDLLRWARERAGLTQEDMSVDFKEWKEWEAGNAHPTFEQVQEIANTLYVAAIHLFLDDPPEEPPV